MLLIDDIKKTVIEPLADQKDCFIKLYDFDLMMGGGHITGYLIDKANIEKIERSLANLCESNDEPFLFAVGDGNHSLATAKECYELNKKLYSISDNHPSRYALAEIGNIHSSALDFEPIYRVVFGVDPEDVVQDLGKFFTGENANSRITYVYGDKKGTVNVYIPDDKLSTGVVQDFIDSYVMNHPGAKVDYIHGIQHTEELSRQPDTIGFIYDGISKDTLFESVKATGALPRKTFSMGESRDKRYYLECRKIK